MKTEKLLKIAPFSGVRVKQFLGRKFYLSTGNYQADLLNLEEVDYKNRPSRADIQVNEGDLLFARMKGTSKVLRIDKNLSGIIVSTGFSIHRTNHECDPKYLSFYLKTAEFEFQKDKYCSGAIQPAITNQGIEKLVVPLPPINDQILIATLLNKVESLIAKRKKSIEDLDKLLKSTFLEIFGDPVRNEKGWEKPDLKQFGKISTGNTPPRKNIENYSTKYIEWIKTDNILSDCVFVKEATEFLSETGLKTGRTIEAGALLVACIAGSVSSIGRAALTDRRVSFNQQINAIQPYDDVNSFYLYELFKISKKYVQYHATKGMKKILTKGEFEKIKMIKPPIRLQNKFASIFKKVDFIKERYRKSLTDMKNLYAALSQKAFKGELDLSQIPLEKEVEAQQEKIEPQTQEAVKTPQDEITTKSADRDQVLRQLFDTFLSNRKGNLFSLEDFWPEAEEKFMELMDDESLPLGMKEYDAAKQWLFDLLESGKAFQSFNEDENRMEIHINP